MGRKRPTSLKASGRPTGPPSRGTAPPSATRTRIYNDTAGGVGTAYNTLIAPPAFILSVRTPDSGAAYERKAYGLRRFSIRASAEWNDVIRMAERMVSDIEVTAVREGSNWGDRPTAEVDSTATYRTLNGAVFAKATGTVALVPYQLGDPLILGSGISIGSRRRRFANSRTTWTPYRRTAATCPSTGAR